MFFYCLFNFLFTSVLWCCNLVCGGWRFVMLGMLFVKLGFRVLSGVCSGRIVYIVVVFFNFCRKLGLFLFKS